jgi:hypothetical protein
MLMMCSILLVQSGDNIGLQVKVTNVLVIGFSLFVSYVMHHFSSDTKFCNGANTVSFGEAASNHDVLVSSVLYCPTT